MYASGTILTRKAIRAVHAMPRSLIFTFHARHEMPQSTEAMNAIPTGVIAQALLPDYLSQTQHNDIGFTS